MIIHSDCGGEVYLDITPNSQLLATIFISKGLVKVGNAKLSVSEKKVTKPSFYCTSCKKSIKSDSLRVKCYDCGGHIEFNSIKSFKEAGGCFCTGCSTEISKRFKDDLIIPLSLDIETITFS